VQRWDAPQEAGTSPNEGRTCIARDLGYLKGPRMGFRLRLGVLRRYLGLLGGRDYARSGVVGGATGGRFGAGILALRRSYGSCRLRGPLALAEIIRKGAASAGAGLERGNHRDSRTLHRPREGQQEERHEAEDQAQSDHLSFLEILEMSTNPWSLGQVLKNRHKTRASATLF